ncbi:MAG: DUF2510 domain-containing protein [Mycobacterium sp.]
MEDLSGRSRPPGWYPDPSGVPALRYHNGIGWTVHREPTRQPPPPDVRAPVRARPAEPVTTRIRIAVPPPPVLTPDPPPHLGRHRGRRVVNRILLGVAVASFSVWMGVWLILGLSMID